METSRTVPNSTYRMQLHGGFTFGNATAWISYLHPLDVTHLFCSPILQASPGSTHGYDVVDYSCTSEECDGEEAFRQLSQAAHEWGIGVVVGVVPNHTAVPTPTWRNHALWDVLRRGPESAHAKQFDLDMTDSQIILIPVLGNRTGRELEHISFTTNVTSSEE